MRINYCNSSGLMSVCNMADNVAGQQFCEFSEPTGVLNKTADRYCMYLGKTIDSHCSSPNAQWDAKCGKKAVPLSEEEVFNIKQQETYPEYRDEVGDVYV